MVTVRTFFGGEEQCSGATTVDVPAGETADATGIVLFCAGDGDTGAIRIDGELNFVPRFHGIWASDEVPVDGEVIDIAVSASDPDGDVLTVSWSDGSDSDDAFEEADSPVTTFDTTGLGGVTVTLTVTVTDGVTTPIEADLIIEVAEL